jgi:hypothetical protein
MALLDIQISFDYDRLPRHIEWRQFEARFGKDAKTHLKFDEVLQNVTFPYVEVQLTGRKADIQKEKEEQSGVRQFGILGRNDMKHFFDWLYAKGVRHIIKVSVQEATKTGEKVHSDKAIRESLERFVVEQLDWQKLDLDPETILHIGSKTQETLTHSTKNSKAVRLHADQQLKVLFLRWGGSNAVLRAWSEPEGLASLPQLLRVYLYKPPMDEVCISPNHENFAALTDIHLDVRRYPVGEPKNPRVRSPFEQKPLKGPMFWAKLNK